MFNDLVTFLGMTQAHEREHFLECQLDASAIFSGSTTPSTDENGASSSSAAPQHALSLDSGEHALLRSYFEYTNRLLPCGKALRVGSILGIRRVYPFLANAPKSTRLTSTVNWEAPLSLGATPKPCAHAVCTVECARLLSARHATPALDAIAGYAVLGVSSSLKGEDPATSERYLGLARSLAASASPSHHSESDWLAY